MKFKKLIALFLLFAFLLPNLVKIEHQHNHFACQAKEQKHLHKNEAKCEVCKFEFSIFSSHFISYKLESLQALFAYTKHYNSSFCFTRPSGIYQLRAPPFYKI
jgi:hypothetical protein